MTMREQLQSIAARALSDDDFAAKLQADPEATLQAEGISLSAEEKADLQQALQEAAQAAGRESKFLARL
ncbi:hypothetical protein SE17_10250 [Kouleothrix aurantiaca]|jgi:hypothetical protein|uniref:Nif11 domain-containing protein n=1 Tax=Kouleothrix aurantiaca TaxID=186479 RepID=A0A0P9DIT1_9CHLR|nr:hypothetical protein SE17_10250 [Kouleothrix aurantiaca]